MLPQLTSGMIHSNTSEAMFPPPTARTPALPAGFHRRGERQGGTMLAFLIRSSPSAHLDSCPVWMYVLGLQFGGGNQGGDGKTG